jgi:hypothetical protein
MLHRQFTADPSIGMSHHPDPYAAFCARRREALEAFREWALSHPSPTDLADEAEGTAGGFRGIAALLSEPTKGTAQ